MWLRTVVKAVTNRKGAVGGAERGPCCFAAGTLVATPEGDRAIETLKVGDIVWTKPEHGGEPFAAAITATHIRNDQPIYRLTLESTRADGQVKTETLFVTPSHPFYVPARHDFVPMGELRAGDLLQSLADGAGNNTSSRVASIRLHKSVGETFNLSVDVGHTFYVGKLKTWVYNTGPCDVKFIPNAGSVGNMGEFFKLPGFGGKVYEGSTKTKQIYDGQSVYMATANIGEYIARGDKFYLDGSHMNHIEVFDSRNKAKLVLNLDGSINEAKTKVAIKQKRKLPR
ncbi:polymorphic toxin-type HINT domain-containing protein [Pseudomonas sp. K13]|nr:polymorphic toxin-type HINT domain-containing protein [Pseudomonas sp. K13]MDO7902973.1 polymorphic toxin-type HINT domain-containing protein [Pseudomonas sp. K13]